MTPLLQPGDLVMLRNDKDREIGIVTKPYHYNPQDPAWWVLWSGTLARGHRSQFWSTEYDLERVA